MANRKNDRAEDERKLEVLRRRADGQAPKQIADEMGVLAPFVSTVSQRIVTADLRESGEPASAVLEAYPWRAA